MRNSFPSRIAASLLAIIASAANAGFGKTSYGGGNKHAKSSFKQNKRKGL